MPKQRLASIAEEYEVPFEEAIKIIKDKIPEEFVTGSGKNTWISEEGQAIINDGFFISGFFVNAPIVALLKGLPKKTIIGFYEFKP